MNTVHYICHVLIPQVRKHITKFNDWVVHLFYLRKSKGNPFFMRVLRLNQTFQLHFNSKLLLDQVIFELGKSQTSNQAISGSEKLTLSVKDCKAVTDSRDSSEIVTSVVGTFTLWVLTTLLLKSSSIFQKLLHLNL